MTFTNYDLARMVEEARAERDRLREALQAVMDARFSSNSTVLMEAWEKASAALGAAV